MIEGVELYANDLLGIIYGVEAEYSLWSVNKDIARMDYSWH